MCTRIESLMVWLTALALVGCTTVPIVEPAMDREHILAMDVDGAIVDLSSFQRGTVTGVPIQTKGLEAALACRDGQGSTGLCEVLHGLETRYTQDLELDLMVFVHGGLNSPAVAIEHAQRQLRVMEGEGSTGQPYPLFIVWNSDGLSSYGDHLWRIRRGTVWGWQAHATSGLYGLFDGIATVSGAPESWAVQGIAPIRSAYVNWDHPCLHVEPPSDKDYLRDRVVVPSETACGGWWRFEPIAWPTTALKVLTTPVVDVLGHEAWSVMRRRADLLSRNSVSHDDFSALPNAEGEVGGVEALARAIQVRLDSGRWKKANVRITLIGHSMGAFVVNDIIRRFPDLPVTTIVHMASADSLRSVEDVIEPYLRIHPEARFYSLMLHPEREDLETEYLNTIPQGSLLTWIDNLYTNPPTRLDRTSGTWDNAGRWLHDLPTDVAPHMCFRVFDYSGEGVPTSHGAFDDLRPPGSAPQYWTREFWTGGECGEKD